MEAHYKPQDIEQQAQAFWQKENSFSAKEELSKEKFYCLSMFPYPSGELHMGHVRNYTLGDVIARYQHALGKNVLHPIGWDAFGLPAENAAIKHKLPPITWTEKNIKKMRKQFQQLGLSFDYEREIRTCEPSYYRWEQWLFLQLYKKDLIYKQNAVVNWDPVDKTVLANEQVINGKGWRSGAQVEQREIPQWFIKITAYAEELLKDLDQLDGWPEQVRTMQRNWIGRSEGINIHFPLSRGKQTLKVYTTRPDTLMGVTYLAIAAEHPLAEKAALKDPKIKAFIKECHRTKVSEAEIATQTKKGILTPFSAKHPITGEKLAIWITNFVLMHYGSGAIMAVPAHDPRDHEFALQYDLAIKPVITPADQSHWEFSQAAFSEAGTLINSAQFDGLDNETAKKKISDFLIKNQQAEAQVNYRLRDWGISRQRYWGTPIPIIHCKDCGEVPVPEEELPVILPTDLIPDGSGSPLTSCKAFYQANCPQCGKKARRETDTMDTFVESSWYYARYGCFDQNSVMLDDRAKYWTPVDQYIGGIEHAVLHLLYARFMHKLLRDLTLLNSNEPFKNLLTQGMVLKDGSKMSKSRGNTIAPHKLIKQFGADTVRLFALFAAPPEQDLEWSDSGVEGCYRFLKKLWHYAQQISEPLTTASLDKSTINPQTIEEVNLRKTYQQIHQILQQANQDMQRLQFNTVVSAAMKIFNLLNKLEPNSEPSLLIIQQGMSILLRLLAPITPHITHNLWQVLKFGDNILTAPWPAVDSKALVTEQIELIVQINGKLRARVEVASEASRDTIEEEVQRNENVKRHLEDKTIKKIIVVPKRLVNIVV